MLPHKQQKVEASFLSEPINSDSVTWINPFNSYGSDDQLIAFSPCFDPLFIVNKDETRWYLAESLEPTAEDGCHYQIKLKEGLTWHDGEPITVDDVIFSIKAIQEPSNSADASNVKYDGNNLQAEKVDDLTVNLTLVAPYSAFETEIRTFADFPRACIWRRYSHYQKYRSIRMRELVLVHLN